MIRSSLPAVCFRQTERPTGRYLNDFVGGLPTDTHGVRDPQRYYSAAFCKRNPGGPQRLAGVQAAGRRQPAYAELFEEGARVRRCHIHERQADSQDVPVGRRIRGRSRRRARLDFRSWDDEATAWTMETLRETGVHIMGSRTFRDMAAYWPTSTEPFAAPMNEIPEGRLLDAGDTGGRPGFQKLGERPRRERRAERRDCAAPARDQQGYRRPRWGAFRAEPGRAQPGHRIPPAGSPDRARTRATPVSRRWRSPVT